MKIELCKGGCGKKAKYSGWCGIKWKKENRICVDCSEIEKKRGKSISKYRIKEAKLGLNPMQNSEICKKNHSLERNRKASETFKNLAKLKLLPQQTESKYKSGLRLSRIRKALQKLSAEGKLNHQIESPKKKKLRHQKISKTVTLHYLNGVYSIPNVKRVKYKSKLRGNIILRSKWELDVAKFLDSNNLLWLYEPFAIPYIDNKKNKHHTIPDFFLPKYNLIIEVKSNRKDFFTASNIENKEKAIRGEGYNFYLWMNKEIEMIRKGNSENLLENIKNLEVENNA